MSKEIIGALIGAAATVLAAVVGVIWSKRRSVEAESVSSSPEARSKKQHRFDVFVSSPLAGLASDEEIRTDHERIAPVVALLEGQLAFAVYWAGRNIQRKADFEAADLSAKNGLLPACCLRLVLHCAPA